MDNYRAAAQLLADRGALALEVDETAATIWALGHPAVYRRLVIEGGWSVGRYRVWIVQALKNALLCA